MLQKFRLNKTFKLIVVCSISAFVIFYWLNLCNEIPQEEKILLKVKALGQSGLNYSYSYKIILKNGRQEEIFDNYSVWVKNDNSIKLSGVLMGKNINLFQCENKVYQLINGFWQLTQIDSLEDILLLPYRMVEEGRNWSLTEKLGNHYIFTFNLNKSPYMLDIFWDKIEAYIWINKNNYSINKIEIRGIKNKDKNRQILLVYDHFIYSR